jgi:ribonuclease BN (tRNA processing enzyme)
VKFIPLGVGDAFTARYYTSCIAIEAEGRWLLVDCPHPIRKVLAEGSKGTLDVPSFEAVVVTHLHADHSSGLEGFGYFSHFVARRKARLAAHPDISSRLWEGHLAAGMERLMPSADAAPVPKGFGDYFELVALPGRIGPFEIETRRTIHHLPTTALRIRAGGRTLGISSDTAFDPSLIAWLMEADLVIHETNYGVHTPYEKLAALPEAERRKMRLIHYSDLFDPAASVIEPLVQGRGYEV